MLKAYHVPSKLSGNLTVPSEAAFAYVQQLESHFLAVIEATAHHLKVCDVLYHHLSSVGDFHFCSAGCRAKFLKMFCRVRLCWHVRFVNRNLDRVRFQSSISGIQLDKFKG
uniref:Putative transposase n=1 Tax=Rhipicephalus microplus TaxID=6941 RepID=A0A6G5ACR6_RHIMP